MSARWQDIEAWVVGVLPAAERHRGRVATRLAAGLCPWGLVFSAIFVALDLDLLAVSLFVAALGVGSGPLVLRATGSLALTAHWMNAFFVQSLVVPAYLLDGVVAACIPWFAIAVVYATFLRGWGAGALWTAIALSLTGGLLVLQLGGHLPPSALPEVPYLLLSAFTHSGFFLLVLGVAAVVWTSHERRAAELSQARLDAEAASRAKSAFLTSMSHELRTPLNAILGYAELLQEDASTEQGADLERIHRSGTHLLGLLNDLLDLARVEAGRMPFEVETVPLDALLPEVVDAARPLIEARGNAARVEATDLVVRADRRRLQQVLLNLVSNASRFTCDGCITLKARADGERVVIEVVDTGEGMAPEALDRIFDRFAQAHEGIAHSHGGTGLGLALVREFVRAMGGEVGVASTLGEGSTFRVTLPRVA